MPAFEAPGQRVHAPDAKLPEGERHPGAGRFVGSRAVEGDLRVSRDLVVAPLELLGADAQSARIMYGRS